MFDFIPLDVNWTHAKIKLAFVDFDAFHDIFNLSHQIVLIWFRDQMVALVELWL